MSYLAIGAVTKAIAELLMRKMNKPPLLGGTTPKVTTLPPDDDRVSESDGVNLFLYRVSVNPYRSNVAWRGDKSAPSAAKRPPLALTLHYLLTAYAKKADGAAMDDITAHQLLGNAMTILHEFPVLNDIHDSDFDASQPAQFAPELLDAYEKVKVSLLPATTMEEFSKIWTGLSKAHRLSVLYDVSLVQIGPLSAASPAGPPVMSVSVGAATTGVPLVESVAPAEGAAGSQVVVRGSRLRQPGGPTRVNFGDVQLAESELVKCTPEELVLVVPPDLGRGPRVALTVSAGGGESAPVFFEVRPWIHSVRPLRGVGGVPLEVPFEAEQGATLALEFDGQQVTSAYDAAARVVTASVPESVASNGLKPVVLLVGDNPAVRSNARFFEVLPQIEAVDFATQSSPAQTTLTVTGRRLAGKDVQVRYGELLVRKGENTTPAQVQVVVTRVLQAGLPVSVIVDGRESNRLPPLLETVEPAAAPPGEKIRLTGRGLSGKTVVAHFGATDVTVGPNAYATQIELTVPGGLEPGEVELTASVNGAQTNALAFEVLG